MSYHNHAIQTPNQWKVRPLSWWTMWWNPYHDWKLQTAIYPLSWCHCRPQFILNLLKYPWQQTQWTMISYETHTLLHKYLALACLGLWSANHSYFLESLKVWFLFNLIFLTSEKCSSFDAIHWVIYKRFFTKVHCQIWVSIPGVVHGQTWGRSWYIL
jgi:hypothetical protein